jgi:hypothetical protein
MAGRDEFNKPTVEVLAKRVGYLCSNPSCRKHTIGPNNIETKSTLIGQAAHITAASPGGPRYDASLNAKQRKEIDNGIWLCSNCATLIDKDIPSYPVTLLRNWKHQAEREMQHAIEGKSKGDSIQQLKPFIEADLIWSSSWRRNKGFSERNHELYGDGPIYAGAPVIIHWDLEWSFAFALYNNSSFPAFNVKVEQDSKQLFHTLSKLPKVNNLPPFANVSLDAKTSVYIEDVFTEADKLLEAYIPKHLEGMEFTITYQDEDRHEHKTSVRIEKGELTSRKVN